VIGYQHIPVREEIAIRVAPVNLALKAMEIIRSILVAGGYFEAMTFSFVTDSLATTFLPPEATGLPRADSRVRKADAQLRPSLLPGRLEAVRRNETTGTAGVKLFETGSVFWLDSAGKVEERRRLGLCSQHRLSRRPRRHRNPADSPGCQPRHPHHPRRPKRLRQRRVRKNPMGRRIARLPRQIGSSDRHATITARSSDHRRVGIGAVISRRTACAATSRAAKIPRGSS